MRRQIFLVHNHRLAAKEDWSHSRKRLNPSVKKFKMLAQKKVN